MGWVRTGLDYLFLYSEGELSDYLPGERCSRGRMGLIVDSRIQGACNRHNPRELAGRLLSAFPFLSSSEVAVSR